MRFFCRGFVEIVGGGSCMYLYILDLDLCVCIFTVIHLNFEVGLVLG